LTETQRTNCSLIFTWGW